MRIKNNTLTAKTWVSTLIAAGEYYEIQAHELIRFQTNSELIIAISNSEAIVNNGSDILDVNLAIETLKDSQPRKVQPVLGTDNYSLFGCSTSFVATKQTETIHDFLIPSEVAAIKGASSFYQNNVLGDYIKVSIVDVDNVLGFGAGTVLNTYIDKWFIKPDSELFVESGSVSLLPAAGLYLRFRYTSIGTTNDVNVWCNFITYKEV